MLRSNVTDWSAEELWKTYIRFTDAFGFTRATSERQREWRGNTSPVAAPQPKVKKLHLSFRRPE